MLNFGKIFAEFIRKIIRKLFKVSLSSNKTMTVIQGWEKYAQDYNQFQIKEEKYLGEEWNEAEKIGIDVPDDQITSYLDNEIFAPFLGNCDILLEIGCGGGRFTDILLPKCHKLIATDTSKTMLKLLQKRFKSSDKIDYLLVDGRSLFPVPDQSVDGVFSYGVFVHLQHWDIYNYLVEIKRVMKPDGKAIIQHANTFSELGWQKFLKTIPKQVTQHKLATTFTLMTPAIMEEFTQRAGLKLQACITNVVKRDCISLIKSPDR